MMVSPVVVRQVWQYNLFFEFHQLQTLVPQFPFISIDTEFPGIIYHHSNVPKHLISSLSPLELYSKMKENIDNLHLIQLGITLSDAHGRLYYVWQFNFREFDCDHDKQNPESISLLKKQGIDFMKNRMIGIDSRVFARLFRRSCLGRGILYGQTWITFHGLYHFGFLIKVLTDGKPLPRDLNIFKLLVRLHFGMAVYDLKPMAQEFGLHGGLEKVAKSLSLGRVGRSHHAGLDSLLVSRVFMEMKRKKWLSPIVMERFKYQLYGLSPMLNQESSSNNNIIKETR